ncbi:MULTISPECIES: DUF4333 domain-containing protein [Prauserella salsuginis group]|uniref:DUF4333 domain-containing protein n=2 Tax=Prauserella salsuginis group TaxID=2893672 RepID=A0A839XNC7_9PSEU|nr:MULTISPECIES: DUF4333 domain-containing protein [Prauserella salsuginis group]MBB3661435.1 hypothetical protein [Prauserella sediminis]MCR3719356.1 protein of unknown function (DUF4333) [Prauserella flava]MCR3735630.1 protein of unknown function (DUF4333) [Prauserella salsuginis]
MSTTARFVAAAAACLTLGLAACSAEVSVSTGPQIEQGELEKQLLASVTAEVGQRPKDLTCPGDVDAEKGARTECTLVAPDGTAAPVSVTVTRVDADSGDFGVDWEVGQPESATADS